MRYLITGGLGVVGSLLTEQLLADGHHVHVIDACEAHRGRWVSSRLMRRSKEFMVGLVIDRLRLEQWDGHGLDDVDFVIHAAAHTGIPHSADDPDDDWRSNVDATRVLLERLRHSSRRTPTVVMSSVKPYRVHDMPTRELKTRYEWDGFQSDPQLAFGVNEHWALEPDEPYAASKLAQSALCMAYARTYDLPVVCLRFSNLYGPAPCHGPRHGWLTWACISAALGRTFQIQGTGKQVRDMLYSSDINSALLIALKHSERLKGQVFNVGGGRTNAISVLEAVDMLGLKATSAAGRKNEDPIFITDHFAFSSATGWSPMISVREGMQIVLGWAEENADRLREIYSRC